MWSTSIQASKKDSKIFVTSKSASLLWKTIRFLQRLMRNTRTEIIRNAWNTFGLEFLIMAAWRIYLGISKQMRRTFWDRFGLTMMNISWKLLTSPEEDQIAWRVQLGQLLSTITIEWFQLDIMEHLEVLNRASRTDATAATQIPTKDWMSAFVSTEKNQRSLK